VTAAAFLTIALIHLAAAISPGPSFAVAVRTAAAEGFRPAAAFAFGLGLGAVAWALAALGGLALLFEVAPVALTVLKVAGGLFLVWIAVATWRHADAPLPEATTDALPRSLASGVRFGLVTQLANPKPAVFFGAVFVGLVPPGTPWPTLALLLAVILLDETLWYLIVARVFSLTRARAAYAGAKAWVDRAFGGLIGAFGLRLAVT
jgi:threonine/homoserine/homoserine lactone efflux protein